MRARWRGTNNKVENGGPHLKGSKTADENVGDGRGPFGLCAASKDEEGARLVTHERAGCRCCVCERSENERLSDACEVAGR